MQPTRFDRFTRTLALAVSRRRALLALIALAGLSRFGVPARRMSASVCGADDSQDVELYMGNLGAPSDLVASLEAPVGNLRWNGDLVQRYQDPGTVNARRWCSGTLIADDLFLTSGYCLDNRPVSHRVPRIDGTEVPISRAEIATNMHVDFNYQIGVDGVDREAMSYPVVELVEDGLGVLDYAILRLAGTPALIFGMAPVGADDVPVGGTICIIGHPDGLQKRVECGPVAEYQDFRIFYNDIDTGGGSGGSGIFASPGGALAGIHTNGGCDAEGLGSNHGIRISALLEVSPILATLAAVGEG